MKDPKDAIVQSWLGFTLFKLNHQDEAITHLKTSIDLSPSADTANNLGNAYLAKGDTDEAIKAYQQAVNISQKSNPARGPVLQPGQRALQEG